VLVLVKPIIRRFITALEALQILDEIFLLGGAEVQAVFVA
jgi:hypothetical protein